ncbi:MAG TPA: flavodoxin domain-containing protein [Prolixibacteraceae bacterium]|nr:flavodoxin domain-containing protein [Prolixibacteraceae bacterium]
MKTAIIYISKNGATEKVAGMLQKSNKTKDIEAFNLKEKKHIDLHNYQNIIIGSPIYAGKIMNPVKRFIDDNMVQLLNMNVSLFICCMDDNRADEELQNAYPELLRKHALFCEHVGGEFNFKRMNFVERTIVKKISGVKNSLQKFNFGKISALADSI